jgi:hypothetical protein
MQNPLHLEGCAGVMNADLAFPKCYCFDELPFKEAEIPTMERNSSKTIKP